MADNFLQAINTGINLGHMADSVQMQRAQMERMAQQFQVEQENHQWNQMIQAANLQRLSQPELVAGEGNVLVEKKPGVKLYEKPEKLTPERLVTSIDPQGNPIRVPDVPGVVPYVYKNNPAEQSKPLFQEKDLGGGVVQKMRYNKQTDDWDIPFGEPVPKYKPTSISGESLSAEELDSTAKMLSTGAITLSDLSKRGGIKQQAALLSRAKELNPNLDPRAEQANNAAFQSAITMQQKQIGMMGSFVKNMDYQVNRVKEIAKELQTFDSRIMNVPLRTWRQKIAGSPLQAKYDMYITEIENEIGKLATGSAASISELSVGAQDKWAKIHDKNLSVQDMVSLLEETAKAGKMRMKSVESQLSETQGKMRARGSSPTATKTIVERRISKTGKKLVKYSDGTIGEE